MFFVPGWRFASRRKSFIPQDDTDLVGAYRGIDVSSVFVISDILSEEDWRQGYHSTEKLDGLKQIFEVALQAIAEENLNTHL